MNFSISNLAVGFIFSIIGFFLFRVAQKRLNIPVVILSIILMSYSIFTPTTLLTLATGLVLCSAIYYFWE